MVWALFEGIPLELDCIKDYKKVLEFANFLYTTGKYESALTEYERLLFLKRTYVFTDSSIDTSMIFLQVGKCYLSLGEYSLARQYLMDVKNDTSYALIGFSLLEEKNLVLSDSVFTQITNAGWQDKTKNHLSALHSLPYKNPLIASLSSTILPGIGRAYAGRLGDGIFSFIFTVGSFALACYYNSSNRLATIGFAGLGVFFYLGNIYGSTSSANLYNDKIFYDELDKFKFDLGITY
jgi:TM2 domain-containing membrane protein YozV